jgi:hypothetical protein
VTLNIASYSDDWRARLLSSFSHTPFELRCGSTVIRCASVEGFWQGLKWPEGSAERTRAFGLWGIEAKLAGTGAPDGNIDYCGRRVPRGKTEHHAIAENAMRAKLEQNSDVTLPKDTFLEIWGRLRDELMHSAKSGRNERRRRHGRRSTTG